MKLYHTYEKKNGFSIDRMNWDRGVFTVIPWWTDKNKYPQYAGKSEWLPNEFGDIVVELDVKDSARTYKSTENIDTLINLYGRDNPKVKKIIDQYELGNWERDDWQKLDELIGKILRKKGYQLLHYTDDPMYGDTWAILDPSIIKNVRHEHD